jgi:hypothetical protein
MSTIREDQLTADIRVDPAGDIYLVLDHPKGRTVLCMDNDANFQPLDRAGASALADLLSDLYQAINWSEVRALRRAGPEPEEFSGVKTPPNDPRHTTEILAHIAHLEDYQVDEIRDALNSWAAAR